MEQESYHKRRAVSESDNSLFFMVLSLVNAPWRDMQRERGPAIFCQPQQELAALHGNPFDSSRVVGLIREAPPA
jgi:hypothetical protein